MTRFRVDILPEAEALHYELKGMVATVLAIAHQRRLPRYWQAR